MNWRMTNNLWTGSAKGVAANLVKRLQTSFPLTACYDESVRGGIDG